MNPVIPPKLSFVNGCEQSQISVFDRGLLYGDGHFTTLAFSDGQLQFWADHQSRLQYANQVFSFQFNDWTTVKHLCQDLASHYRNGIIKLIFTRGESGRGYQAVLNAPATWICQLFPPPDYQSVPKSGVHVFPCQTRLSSPSVLAGLKHLNRLEQVWARREFALPDYHEGLVLDAQQYVIEGTVSNIFVLKDNVCKTPALSECGVKGVVRSVCMKALIDMGWQLEETSLVLDDLFQADDVFLTNSAFLLWPVAQLGQRVLTQNHRYKPLLAHLHRIKYD